MEPKQYFIQGLWGGLQQSISSTPPIEYMIDSLDTGQTEDDTFNSKPIDPELDDSEQFTGDSIQPYLTLVGQLQWLVTLERVAIHAKSLPCPCSGQLQGSYKGPMVMSKRSLISIGFSLNTISVKC